MDAGAGDVGHTGRLHAYIGMIDRNLETGDAVGRDRRSRSVDIPDRGIAATGEDAEGKVLAVLLTGHD
jgi:hypothetical protein